MASRCISPAALAEGAGIVEIGVRVLTESCGIRAVGCRALPDRCRIARADLRPLADRGAVAVIGQRALADGCRVRRIRTGGVPERGGVRFIEAPGLRPRDRSLTLRGKIDDDFRFFRIEQLEQAVLLVDDVNLVVRVARVALADIERERLRFLRIAADADDFFRIGVLQQIERRMHAENAVAAENDVSFHFKLLRE